MLSPDQAFGHGRWQIPDRQTNLGVVIVLPWLGGLENQ
jgi:hypothetical protein